MTKAIREHCHHRIACNKVITPQGQQLTRYVVELEEEGWVANLFPLEEELAFTEWRPGMIELRNEHGRARAYYNNKPII